MPTAPARPCPQPYCPNLQPCPVHARQYDRERGSASARGYGRRWQRVRLMVLREEPLCRRCKQRERITPATEVHHIDGDVTNLLRSNLEPLCKPCHSTETVRRQGALRQG